MQKDQIVHYYETCEKDYRWLWDLDNSHAMHAGYWDQHTRTLRQALKRENEVLAEMAEIKKGELILDAGCGVGGSSIFLAQTYGCHVTGITLSSKQVQTAQSKAIQAGVQHQTVFQVADYTCTDFVSNIFDVVWGLESVCHAVDKRLFIKEAMRLLKPGGRLIVADGFAKDHPNTLKDQEKMECWLKGWGVKELNQANGFKDGLEKEGFKEICFYDITPHVLPSSRRLYWYSWPAIPLSKLGEWLRWRNPSQTANLYSARCQYQTLRKGLWQYGIFYAKKN